MSQISPSILRALSNLVPDTLNYVCLVEYDTQMWFLALGRKSFYFISQNLEKYKIPPIPYQKIESCRICDKRKTLMQIQLKKYADIEGESKDPAVKLEIDLKSSYGVNEKNLTILNIYNQDRKQAIDSFKCYWQIDSMIQSRCFRNFPLFDMKKEDIIKKDKNTEIADVQDNAFNGLNLKKEFKYPPLFFSLDIQVQFPFTLKGYRFFVSKKYKEDHNKESEVKDESDPSKIITFQVKDPVSIDFLDKMADKDRELKLISEQIADDFLLNQSFQSKDEDLNHQRMLISSKPYTRKSNLIADKALNQCWEIHYRFNNFDLYVTILRRSYIPPMMDMYQDIIVCSRFPFKAPNHLGEPSESEIEQINKNSGDHLISIHRTLIDSIHQIDIGSQTTFFKVFLEKRANALLFSEETCNFYQYNVGVTPDCLVNAFQYLMCLINLLLGSGDENKFKDLSKLIYKKIKIYNLEKQISQLQDCRKIVAAMEDKCYEYIDLEDAVSEKQTQKQEVNLDSQIEENKNGQLLDENDNSMSPKKTDKPELQEKQQEKTNDQKKNIHEKKHNWNAKVARYLAYAVDGGLLCSQFTLSQIINYLQSSNLDPSDEAAINYEIAYLLHNRRIGKDYEHANIDKQFKDIQGNFKQHVMNFKVLVVLIESNYCQQQLNQLNKSDYPKFLITVLKETDKRYLKEACCRMIIKYFGKNESKDAGAGEGEGDADGKIEFINLVEPLVQIITKIKESGQKLTALSVMALVNMCNFSEDIKDIFLQKNGFNILNELLDCKDEEILLNTLKLIMTLITQKSTETSQIGRTLAEQNKNSIILKIIKIIKEGPSIYYCNFSKEVNKYCIFLLRAFIQYSIDVKKLIMNDREKSLFCQKSILKKLCDMISKEQIKNIDSEIEGNIISLFTQVIKEEIEYKRLVGQNILDNICLRLQLFIKYRFQQAKIEFDRKRNQLQPIEDKDKIPEQAELSIENEKKIWVLIGILLKNSDSLILQKLKAQNTILEEYKQFLSNRENELNKERSTNKVQIIHINDVQHRMKVIFKLIE